VEGVLGVLAGIVAFLWPGLTALALLYLVAAWAIVTGILQLVGAIRLRQEIEGEWLLILSGILSVIFGVLLAALPGVGILALVWLIGAYAVASGILLIILAFRVRNETVPEGGETPSATAERRFTEGGDQPRPEGNGTSSSTAERRFTEGSDLVKASDSDSALEDRAQDDVRGREVRDHGGEEIGTVEDVYVDREGATPRFLVVVSAAPGFAGGRFLIPTEAVSGMSADQVMLNQDRNKVADSPSFEREPDRRYQAALYRYYGYP
jgi:sporulation protein YlmC with PRC-barrel domain